MSAELDQLVQCDRFRDKFPRGMPVRGCLRRQLERQESTKKGEAGPPRRPFCAETCQLGRAVRSRLNDVGLAYCPRCGSALIGAVECALCAEREREKSKEPARGFLPTGRAPVSERIWAKDAPDAPIGPAPSAPKPPPRVGLAAPDEPVPRVRQARAGWGTVLVEDVDQGDEVELDEVEEPPRTEVEKRAQATEAPAETRNIPLEYSRAFSASPAQAEAAPVQTPAPAPAHVAPVDPERPAEEPAKEDPMKKTCSACGKEIRERNGKLQQPCYSCRKKRASSAKPVVAKVVGAERAARAVEKATEAVRDIRITTSKEKAPARARARRPLEGKTVLELIAIRERAQTDIADVELELKARQEELAAALEGRSLNATAPALAEAAGA